jgi:hypothetical protein
MLTDHSRKEIEGLPNNARQTKVRRTSFHLGGSISFRPGGGDNNFCDFSTTTSFANSTFLDALIFADEDAMFRE